MNKGTTVNELLKQCQQLVWDGFGDKVVLISDDDEGNGFHTLYYGFTTNKNEIAELEDIFHDGNNPKDVVLLG